MYVLLGFWNTSIGCSFKFLLKVDVEELIVNAAFVKSAE
jgi:hypothetical protein